MKILFIHQNFPGQYKHLAPMLAARGHDCTALTLKVTKPTNWQGVRVLPYALPNRTGQNLHPWLVDLDTKVTRAEACFKAARTLRDTGFTPDLILAHPGWGEAMFLKDVWPTARMALYCELYYLTGEEHLDFDPEFARQDSDLQALRIRLKNLNNHLHFAHADAGLSPTRFQADTFPAEFREKITICHDGIDTTQARPNANASLRVNGRDTLTRSDEVITFVNRNLEPMRGYHRFMRALPRLLKERPKAQILIVGGDEVSYGITPPIGKSWKQVFISEVRPEISDHDWTRVHFLGRLPYDQFLSLLQISRVHVYLTYPFVLSWSLLEAMSCEAAIVASDTAPVREVVRHGHDGRLIDFFDQEVLLKEICSLLEDKTERATLGRNARKTIKETYDLNSVCLPKQMQWLSQVMNEKTV